VELYSRNRLYISPDEQELIRETPILLAGSGIGSNIAECALRFGFENITIVDGDKVEVSNLNRQNYTNNDVTNFKADSIQKRLLEINPNAQIKCRNEFISDSNVAKIVEGHQIAINALDFTTDIPLKFDKHCQEKGISVLHPYNLGWGGVVTVITADTLGLDSLKKGSDMNELVFVDYVANYLRFWEKPYEWLEKIIEDYKNESEVLPPPQLPIASWIVAGICTHIMFNIATGKPVKKFPEFYINSLCN